MKVHLFPAKLLSQTEGGEFNVYRIHGLDEQSRELLKEIMEDKGVFDYFFDYQMLRGKEIGKSLDDLWEKICLKPKATVCILFDSDFERAVKKKMGQIKKSAVFNIEVEVEDRGFGSIDSGFPTMCNGEHDSRSACLRLDSFREEKEKMSPRLLKEIGAVSGIGLPKERLS